MKKLAGALLIAFLIEGMTYYWGLFQHIESFFFVWATLYLGLFLIEVFRIDTGQLGLLKYQLLKAKFKEVPNQRVEIESEKPGVVSNRILVFALMLLVNAATFLLLLP